MTLPDSVQHALWRADMYRLLAVALVAPAADQRHHLAVLIDDLASLAPVFAGPFREPLQAVHNALPGDDAKHTAEYSRLFLTATACPAAEGSYHLADRGAILGDVAAFYSAFRVTHAPHHGPPDTITAQLWFMHYLALKQVHAHLADASEGFAITRAAERSFLRDHLGRWAPRFAERLRDTTVIPFYRHVAELLAVWIRAECVRCHIEPPPLPTTLRTPPDEACLRCPRHAGGAGS